MVRQTLLRLSRDARVQRALMAAPVTPDLVKRFVAGETVDQVVDISADLIGKGLSVVIDHLGEDATSEQQTEDVTSAYLDVLSALAERRLAGAGEVAVKLSALGMGLGSDGLGLAEENARTICNAAAMVGSAVTIDMEDHTTTDDTLDLVARLRADHPTVGLVLQAYLHRSVEDARTFAVTGSRVRLCKGAYSRVPGISFAGDHEIDLSYVRCLRILMEGDGYPMVATHDPRLIAITERLARDTGRAADSFEFQMLYGIRPVEQRRLVDVGHRSRVYLPYGTQWYEYFVRRVAEKPSTMALIGRSLVSRR